MVFRCLPRRFVCDQDSYLRVQYRDGHVEYLQGPRELWYSGFKHERIEVCQTERHVASLDQRITVKHRDGKIEHIVGPHQIARDPLLHESISVSSLQRKVADANEYVIVVYRDGATDVLFGPAEVIFDPEKHESVNLKRVQRNVADQSQYLIVQFADGRKEHMRGPVELCTHPIEHISIETQNAVRLAANEAIVVYRRAAAEGSVLTAKLEIADGSSSTPLLTAEAAGQEGAVHVERRVVHGPAVFMPDSNEWIHTFSWHGSLKNGKGSKTGYAGDEKVPHALNFSVLRCMPDQMYYSVKDVRTLDDANLTVHLMIFYELTSIETMLDATNDPIGDYINAASADVMTYASVLTYEQFLASTSDLSLASSFPILNGRMEGTGTALRKVVYRGYSASAQLQEMHDESIAQRTKLRLESDAAKEEQEQRAMELRCRAQRAAQEQKLEAEATRHKLEVLSMEEAHGRAISDEEHAQALRYAAEKADAEMRSRRARHEEDLRRQKEEAELRALDLERSRLGEIAKLEGMKGLGVDLTAYLCALATKPPDQHLKIDTTADGGAAPNFRLELPANGAKPANGVNGQARHGHAVVNKY